MFSSKFIALAAFLALIAVSKVPASLTTASVALALSFVFGLALVPLAREAIDEFIG
jgi:hypothetical protein